MDMEIRSDDRGVRPQCVQNVSCMYHIRTDDRMASALGRSDLRPGFQCPRLYMGVRVCVCVGGGGV